MIPPYHHPTTLPGAGIGLRRRLPATLFSVLWTGAMLVGTCGLGQIDPFHRNLLQIGYDQPINHQGPQAVYAYYYYNNPEIAGTNTALRLAIAPLYFDGELGFKSLLSENTHLGVGLYGGALGDNYYEVDQGDYRREESFYGSGGGTAVSIYHLLNPDMRIPLNIVARGGFRFSVYDDTKDTADDFEVPDNRPMPYVRTGLRLAGKEPTLYPDLAMEVSVWYERQWRLNNGSYGYDGDRTMEAVSNLYWAYAGLNYAWTNIDHQISFAAMYGDSNGADRLSAWRLGGVLPLVAEFPLIIPGYFYQELTAEQFVYLYGAYTFPLEPSGRLRFRIEAAGARLNYLPGFEQPEPWQMGVGCGLTFAPLNRAYQVVLRYGYGFNAIRDEGEPGGQSVGILFQYDFEKHINREK